MINCKMIFAEILHYIHIMMLLSLAVHSVEGVMCDADLCQARECSYGFECRLPGFRAVDRADNCGCCPACVETLDEGSECSPGPAAYIYANGSYTWNDHPHVCKYGMFCSINVPHPVCKPLTTCQTYTCDGRRKDSQCASKHICSPGFKSVLYSDVCGCCSSCVETLDEGSACFPGSHAIYVKGLYTWRDYQSVCKDGLYCVNSIPYPICKPIKPAVLCDANACQYTRCASSLECMPGFKHVPRAGPCGCCAACLEILDEGIACFPGPYMHTYANGSYAWSDYLHVCKEGLYCEKNVTHPVCKSLTPENCAYKRELTLVGAMKPGQYVPQCAPDGSYRAKQCGPGPECHCVNEQNIRIGEYSIPIWEAENMTCLCAREQLSLPDSMIECTELGNFCEFGACSSGRVLSHTEITSFLLMVACLCLLISDV